MIYFTADHHFGHRNIIKYCDRPFENITEMDNIMIARWHEVVSSSDIVYYLGDFTLETTAAALKYLCRLTCRIKFIPGSHDKWLNNISDCVTVLPPIVELKVAKMQLPIVLCHYAMRSWPRSFHGSYHLYGHSHGRLEETRQPRSMDVGIDCWDFYPVALDTVIAKLSKDIDESLD